MEGFTANRAKGRTGLSSVAPEHPAQGWERVARPRARVLSVPLAPLRSLASLPIRTKLMLTHAGLVSLAVLLLVWLTLGSYRSSLEGRLVETCLLAARQLAESEVVKTNLIAPGDDEIAGAELQAQVVNLERVGIQGFRFAYVADRQLRLRAHTDFLQRGKAISDTALAAALHYGIPQLLTNRDVLEVAYPVLSRRPTPRGTTERVPVGLVGVGLSRHEVLRPLYRAQRTAALGVLSVLAVSALLIVFVSDRMTQQVDRLVEGIRRLGRGELNVSIQVLTRDELGALAHEFNRMIVSLREKIEMQKYISPLTVQMIRRQTTTGRSNEVSKVQNVALLFTDVRNFSAVADTYPPDQVVEILNVYLDLQAQLVERYGGMVDKFVGDEVMAVFLGPSQVENALRAACEIQKAMVRLNARRAAEGLPTVDVGIGIHSGPAVTGSVGSRERKDYTVLGDSVNVAFRLCSMAQPRQVLVTEAIVAAADPRYIFTGEQSVQLKGRSHPIRVFELDWRHPPTGG
ncbi:MAG: HAMP domain-containing protein [candidate division KSB1 bacterium]|nr:HAMP domain-containing protein [candidate division KSB1 bacterium]